MNGRCAVQAATFNPQHLFSLFPWPKWNHKAIYCTSCMHSTKWGVTPLWYKNITKYKISKSIKLFFRTWSGGNKDGQPYRWRITRQEQYHLVIPDELVARGQHWTCWSYKCDVKDYWSTNGHHATARLSVAPSGAGYMCHAGSSLVHLLHTFLSAISHILLL